MVGTMFLHVMSRVWLFHVTTLLPFAQDGSFDVGHQEMKWKFEDLAGNASWYVLNTRLV